MQMALGPFIPHGHCYLWKPGLMWLHAASDGLIAIAYFLIAIALIFFVQQRRDVPFRTIFWLFAAFIIACGLTHTLAIWTLWVPQYWISGGMKAVTALISLYTALTLIPLIPQALTIPSPYELEKLNQTLKDEISQRQAAEAAAQQLNQELEQRVAERTAELVTAQRQNEALLLQEQSARLELEQTLEIAQNTTEHLNLALSAAQMGTWDWNIDTQSHTWSPKTKMIFGFPAENGPCDIEAWRQRVHPADLPTVQAQVDHCLQTQTDLHCQYRLFWSDGSLHWIDSCGRIILSRDGQLRRMVGVAQEITERKQAELTLASSEARFRAVFEQAAVGMARLDPSGRWIQVNQRLCDTLGYSPEEFLQQRFHDITHPEDLPQDEQYYQQLLQGEIESCRFEKRYLHRQGHPVWVLVTVSTEQTTDGELVAFIAVIEDISDRKQNEQELKHRAEELAWANRMLAQTTGRLKERNAELDQFAYVASHDLKAPLRAIANLSEWIEEDLEGQLPPENQRQMKLLRGRVNRMEALINGLLEYSRVGRRDRLVAKVDVNQLLHDILDSLDPPEAFEITLPAPLPPLKANQVALSQVFFNLINNAIKHHETEQGQIQIMAQDCGNCIEFTVADDGPGIDPQYHQKVFTIFQTLKSRDEFESTGIGLAIVKKIVESEGGTITLESSLGTGATFRFTWPKGTGD